MSIRSISYTLCLLRKTASLVGVQSNGWLTIGARYKSMRQWPLFSVLVLCLGGCASSTTPGVDARASYTRPAFAIARTDLDGRPRLAALRSKSAVRHAKALHKSAADQPSVVSTETEPTQTGALEPRPNSTAWWLRENVRVGKAIVICKVCLAETVSGVLQPKPAVPTQPSSAQAVR
jgi:hypothetical protein